MSYCRQISMPLAEPVTLAQVRKFMRLPAVFTNEDDILTGFIQAAREEGEKESGLALAKRRFTHVLDSFPYYTDTIASQLAYPPSYYALPRYATTLWNYSQMIKLAFPPAHSVEQIRYIGTDGIAHVLQQDRDFVFDRISEPARIFPIPGSYWPANQYVANALQIDFTAGYDADPTKVDTHALAGSPPVPGQQPDSTIVSGIPWLAVFGIMNLAAYWFNNRGAVGTVPEEISRIFARSAVIDFCPTRG